MLPLFSEWSTGNFLFKSLSCVLLTRNSSECNKWWCLPVPRSDSSSGSKAPVRKPILWRWDRPTPFYLFSSLVVRSLRMRDSLGGVARHRSYGRSCTGRGFRPLHHMTLVSSTLPVGECEPRWRLIFKQSSFYHIARVLRSLSYSALGYPPR
jgi:hypothetical protein